MKARIIGKVIEGQPVNVDCEAHGSKPLKFEWLKVSIITSIISHHHRHRSHHYHLVYSLPLFTNENATGTNPLRKSKSEDSSGETKFNVVAGKDEGRLSREIFLQSFKQQRSPRVVRGAENDEYEFKPIPINFNQFCFNQFLSNQFLLKISVTNFILFSFSRTSFDKCFPHK